MNTLALVVLVVSLTDAYAQPRHAYIHPDVLSEVSDSLANAMTLEWKNGKPQSIRVGEDGVPAPTFTPAPTQAPLGPQPRIGPDRKTQSDDALTYRMSFNPSVAPMKRGYIFDKVDSRYVGCSPIDEIARQGRSTVGRPPGYSRARFTIELGAQGAHTVDGAK